MLFEKIKLEKEEEVLKIVRKHWFILAAELFGVFLMALMPFFVLVFFALLPEALDTFLESIRISASLITFLTAAWLLLTLMSGFTIWTHYYLDLWIITDRRIIAVDQIAFFSRNVSIFRFERLQDIEVKVSGLIATFLDFGSINAQTAGHFESNFRETGMPKPRELQAIVQAAMDARLQKLRGTDVVRHQLD